MDIHSVKYTDSTRRHYVARIDDKNLIIPVEGQTHWNKAIKQWIADGNTVEEE